MVSVPSAVWASPGYWRQAPASASESPADDRGKECLNHGRLAKRRTSRGYLADRPWRWPTGTNGGTSGLLRHSRGSRYSEPVLRSAPSRGANAVGQPGLKVSRSSALRWQYELCTPDNTVAHLGLHPLHLELELKAF